MNTAGRVIRTIGEAQGWDRNKQRAFQNDAVRLTVTYAARDRLATTRWITCGQPSGCTHHTLTLTAWRPE